MAKIICKVFGILFVAIGLVVFARGGQVDPYHNLLHVATGLVALYFGFVGSASGARRFCQAFGLFYLALGGLGMLLGDPALDRAWQAGPLSLETADHVFHIVLGLIFLGSGLLTRIRAPRIRVPVPG